MLLDELNLKYEDIVDKQNIYGNWIEPHSIQKQYIEFSDFGKISDVLQEYIQEFNDFYPKMKLNLVLFEDAVEFICKINRIIS